MTSPASTDNTVEMHIPYNNPLYHWVTEQRFDKPISYATLSVDGIEARLALVAVPSIYHQSRPDERTYITTEWLLLRGSQ